MSNEEFENYVALMGKLLQFSPEQRNQISGELQDHLQMRVADLVSEGVARPEAISQALEEFGDAAVMAKNFQTVINLKRRRWIMRFATFSIAGVFLAAVLTMAMWPDNSRFGAPDKSMAQAEAAKAKQSPDEESELNVSDATRRTLEAEEALKQVVDLNFDESPFNDVEQQLEESTGLNFLLHSSAMDDSLGEDEPITFNLTGIPLNKALSLMLEIKNATYVIDEGVVLIISRDDAEAEEWLRLKMFDCRELVKQLPETHPTSNSSDGGFGGGGFGGGGKGGGMFSVPPQFGGAPAKKSDDTPEKITAEDSLDQKLTKILTIMKAQAEQNRPAPSRDQTLLDLIQSMIRPDSWGDTGQGLGQIEVVNGILVVAQTEEILREIENFVADLEGKMLQKGKPGIKVRTSSNQLPKSIKGSQLGSKEIGEDPFGGKSDPVKDKTQKVNAEKNPFANN